MLDTPDIQIEKMHIINALGKHFKPTVTKTTRKDVLRHVEQTRAHIELKEMTETVSEDKKLLSHVALF